MKTRIFTKRQIKEAAELIKKGELVAFPTETVYGLGANALDSRAVGKIFRAKGRPSDNPLIIHISDKDKLNDLADIPERKKRLVLLLLRKFWPGPLTIILKKKSFIPDEVTAGLETVAVRMPNNGIALSLIRYSGMPIAAPSANISGKPSGTCFEHVFDDFNGKIAGIIKSDDCEIGLESTVIDMSGNKPFLLRPGGVTYESLKKIIPGIKIVKNKVKKPKSPGMKYKHYAPEAKVILFEKSAYKKIPVFKEELKKQNKKFLLLKARDMENFHKKMFRTFRECDKNGVEYILIPAVEERGMGLALMNRLRKSALKIIK